MDLFKGKTAVVYSNIPMDVPESHYDHVIPILHWCRDHGVKVLREFKEDSLYGGRIALRRCIDFVSEEKVDLVLVDSIRILGGGDCEVFSAVQDLRSAGATVMEVRNGDARIIERIADCIPPRTLKNAIDNRPFPRGMDVRRSVSRISDEEDGEDVVNVEPEVERTEDTITFVFNVPKGVREFTIRIREVDE